MYNTEQVCKGSAFLFVCKDPAGLLEQSNYGNHRLVNIQNFRLVNTRYAKLVSQKSIFTRLILVY